MAMLMPDPLIPVTQADGARRVGSWWQTSDVQTADAALRARPCVLGGAILVGDGTNACTLILYDNASAASGVVLTTLRALGNASVVWNAPAPGIPCTNGIYADVGGTGATYVVYSR